MYGKYTLYDADHEQVYCYTRILGKAGIVVILNFSKELVHYTLPAAINIQNYDPLVNNETSLQLEGNELVLLPYQALLFALRL